MVPNQAGAPSQQQAQSVAEKQKRTEEAAEQRRVVLRTLLEPGALERLHRVALVKPEKVQSIEEYIVQNGSRLSGGRKINEEQLVSLLTQMEPAGEEARGPTVKHHGRSLDREGDARHKAVVVDGDSTGLWLNPALPRNLREELIPEVVQCLSMCEILTRRDVLDLLDYCVLWHPRLPRSLRTQYMMATGKSLKHVLPYAKLCGCIRAIAAQKEILRLVADRGPDFGITLLLFLDLAFQASFFLIRYGPGRDNSTPRAIQAVSQILEVISLHLDCPPLRPAFVDKFSTTVLGFVFHRYIAHGKAIRFFQLYYFAAPHSRHLCLAHVPVNVPWAAFDALEDSLWTKAQELSIGVPPRGHPAGTKDANKFAIACRRDAMAVVFERLNHLALSLFKTSLCLYGSAATGFATMDSDVDVVLQLGPKGTQTFMEEIEAARQNADFFDVNPFPGRSQGGFNKAVGNWAWVKERDPSVAATIWAGRKFAWAVHRLLGWDVQCVQSAYVPIVRITACVDAHGNPRALKAAFRPVATSETSYLGANIQAGLALEQRRINPYTDDQYKNLFFLGAPGWQDQLARLVAINVVSEHQYASWDPQITPNSLLESARKVLRLSFVESPPELPSFDDNHPLLNALIPYARKPSDVLQLSDEELCCGPGLTRACASESLSDGRLTVDFIAGAAPQDPDVEIWMVEADCSMSRTVGIHNSRLLRAYAHCDARVVALGLLIKRWAKAKNIGDAYAGYLSGYQWTLLLIHYLQHFSCVTPPKNVQEQPGFQELQAAYESAGLPPPTQLPLLPNLQLDPPAGFGFEKKKVVIEELEGQADVSFFQPGLGQNRSLPRRLQEAFLDFPRFVTPPESPSNTPVKAWPEETLLESDPLQYAVSLLSVPHKLTRKQKKAPEDETSQLWQCRLQSAPRPSASSSSAYDVWDAKRQRTSTKMQLGGKSPSSNEEQEQILEPYPDMTGLRNSEYASNYVMTRHSLLLPFQTQNVSLLELFYGFFEYYGLRFNFATEMSDIDRVPRLPASKKEYFATGFFTPTLLRVKSPTPNNRLPNKADAKTPADEEATTRAPMENDLLDDPTEDEVMAADIGGVGDSSLIDPVTTSIDAASATAVVQKEVLGRGNGPRQFQGRHFICIRDPFERTRTIGPQFRCQSQISNELLEALQIFGFIRSPPASDKEHKSVEGQIAAAVSALGSCFLPRRNYPFGNTAPKLPKEEAMADALERMRQPYSQGGGVTRRGSLGGDLPADFKNIMYPMLVQAVIKRSIHGHLLRDSRMQPEARPDGPRRTSYVGSDHTSTEMKGGTAVSNNLTTARPPPEADHTKPTVPPPPPPPPPGFNTPRTGLPGVPPGFEYSTEDSSYVDEAIEMTLRSCSHFMPNRGKPTKLQDNEKVQTWKYKEYPDPLNWLQTSVETCRCLTEFGDIRDLIEVSDMKHHDTQGAAARPPNKATDSFKFETMEEVVGQLGAFSAHEPEKAPRKSKTETERMLLDIIQGKQDCGTETRTNPANSAPTFCKKPDPHQVPKRYTAGRGGRGGHDRHPQQPTASAVAAGETAEWAARGTTKSGNNDVNPMQRAKGHSIPPRGRARKRGTTEKVIKTDVPS